MAAFPFLQRRWAQILFTIFSAFLLISCLVYIDVVTRARHAFLEGEKYMAWYANPSLKEKALQEEFAQKRNELEKKFQNKKMSEADYQSELEGLDFDKKYQMQESSLKNAYAWYKDAYELFSPPESKWVRLARQKAPQTLEMWKQELREKKIPFEDTMVQ